MPVAVWTMLSPFRHAIRWPALITTGSGEKDMSPLSPTTVTITSGGSAAGEGEGGVGFPGLLVGLPP
jgi:hypothetical protein